MKKKRRRWEGATEGEVEGGRICSHSVTVAIITQVTCFLLLSMERPTSLYILYLLVTWSLVCTYYMRTHFLLLDTDTKRKFCLQSFIQLRSHCYDIRNKNTHKNKSKQPGRLSPAYIYFELGLASVSGFRSMLFGSSFARN